MRRPPALPAAAAAALVALAAGCVTEKSPRHKDVPPPPSDARATSVQLFAAAPRDTNSNGYGDSILVTVYLFDEQRYPLSLALPGALTFDLRSAKEKPIASWSFGPEETARHVETLGPGPGYSFELRLLDKASDVMEGQEASLTVEFVATTGQRVRSAGGTALRLGRVSP